VSQYEYVVSRDGKTLGYLVIDSTVAGESSGGVRMSQGVTLEEMRLLAENMTRKYGFLGIPQGGAKAGIVFDPEAPSDARREALSNFGMGIQPFLECRSYVPGPDLGVTREDVDWMLAAACGSRPASADRPGMSHDYTGVTVSLAAEMAAGRLGLDLRKAGVAIEGFGKVGAATATRLAKSGARIVAVSTSRGGLYNEQGLDVSRLKQESARNGSAFVLSYKEGDRIMACDLPFVEADIFCPCAQHHSISQVKAGKIRARIISAGANVPFTADAEAMLSSRGILCLPDFVANCGGVLGTFLEIAGLNPKKIPDAIRGIVGPRIEEMIRVFDGPGRRLREYAVEMAEENFLRLKKRAEGRGPGAVLNPSVLRFGRRILPSGIVGRMAVRYFEGGFERNGTGRRSPSGSAGFAVN
jgi:glutamate dehydrogenase (NAD(P)+)